jgi:flavin reductase (DIM6/NTAB) family NADH-FMN oxidoreductase RutF
VETKQMQFDPAELEQSAVYKLLTGVVIPRPIGWVSSISEDGINNLAPFSYFNAIGEDPPHVMFSTTRGGDKNKDTLNNVLANKQFVVNMVTEDTVERMNMTSQVFAADVDEFEVAGLTPIPSVKIKPMRVAESPVTFECELVHHYSLEGHKNGGATMLIGKIIMMHIEERILLDNYKINLETYRPVARLSGSNYSTLGNIFSIKRN